MAYPPAVVSMADQMTAEMTERSASLVSKQLAAEGLSLSEDDALYVQIGIGAAITTTMQVLIERGLLASSSGE